MRKSLYFVLFIVLFNICRGTNSFDLEYLLQQKLQNQPPNRFVQMERDDQEYMQLLDKMEARQLAAQEKQWKQEMQNYYAAKASQSIPSTTLIEKISEDAVAYGGRRNQGLV